MAETRPLSKGRFLAGLQCEKRLWYEQFAPRRIPPVPDSRTLLFEEGRRVGELAQRLFPGGIALAPETRSWSEMTRATQRLLAQRRPIFEAALAADGGACRVDVLEPADGDAWHLIEVKMSTRVKPTHLDDVAFQAHVAESAGLRLAGCSLVHVDNSYVRGDRLEPARLFRRVDVSREVAERRPAVTDSLRQLLTNLSPDGPPPVPIGPHCNDPHECPLIPVCWGELPQGNVTELRNGGRRSWEWLEAGVVRLTELPADAALTRAQRVQVEAARRGEIRLDARRLGKFLARLAPPLLYLDFETFGPAIPELPGTRPFEAIPFQFSLHLQERPGEEPRWAGHLAAGAEDPRPALYERLRRELPPEGTIVAWNAPFERRVLQGAAALGAEWGEWGRAAAARVVDLMQPFARFDVYHPLQAGSTSLKAVLPALTGQGYEGGAVADGQQAAAVFLRLHRGEAPPGEEERIRTELEAYCRQDTAGMVEILERLRGMVGT